MKSPPHLTKWLYFHSAAHLFVLYSPASCDISREVGAPFTTDAVPSVVK